MVKPAKRQLYGLNESTVLNACAYGSVAVKISPTNDCTLRTQGEQAQVHQPRLLEEVGVEKAARVRPQARRPRAATRGGAAVDPQEILSALAASDTGLNPSQLFVQLELDVDGGPDNFYLTLRELIHEGKVSEQRPNDTDVLLRPAGGNANS